MTDNIRKTPEEQKIERTFKLSVRFDTASKEFSPGMGIGVLGWTEVTFNLTQSQYDSPMFPLALLEHQERLRDELIKMDVEEVIPQQDIGPTP